MCSRDELRLGTTIHGSPPAAEGGGCGAPAKIPRRLRLRESFPDARSVKTWDPEIRPSDPVCDKPGREEPSPESRPNASVPAATVAPREPVEANSTLTVVVEADTAGASFGAVRSGLLGTEINPLPPLCRFLSASASEISIVGGVIGAKNFWIGLANQPMADCGFELNVLPLSTSSELLRFGISSESDCSFNLMAAEGSSVTELTIDRNSASSVNRSLASFRRPRRSFRATRL